MLGAVLLILLPPILVLALAAQVPLGSTGYHRQDEHNEDWSLGTLPNPNATDHLVFETVHSLLQHWPNTRMRNGKRSVPCLAFPRTPVPLQAITSSREPFRLAHSSTTARRATSYHRVRNLLLQILNIRISSAGIKIYPVFWSKDVGISRSRPLDHSKSYISTGIVGRSFRMAQWTRRTLSHGVDILETTIGSVFKTSVNGERTLAWMVL